MRAGASAWFWRNVVMSPVANAVAPTVYQVTPTPGNPGSSVTIVGRDFVAGATVTFNGVPAAGVVVVQADEITCTVPFNAPGTSATVQVTTVNGAGSKANGFVYLP